MTMHTILQAAVHLCSVLADENEALAALDIPRANALLEAKRHATEMLVAAQRDNTLPATAEAMVQARNLDALAGRNKLLLERAIAAQHRVLGCIARAIPRAAGQVGRYGAGGRMQTPRSLPPMAHLSQI